MGEIDGKSLSNWFRCGTKNNEGTQIIAIIILYKYNIHVYFNFCLISKIPNY